MRVAIWTLRISLGLAALIALWAIALAALGRLAPLDAARFVGTWCSLLLIPVAASGLYFLRRKPPRSTRCGHSGARFWGNASARACRWGGWHPKPHRPGRCWPS